MKHSRASRPLADRLCTQATACTLLGAILLAPQTFADPPLEPVGWLAGLEVVGLDVGVEVRWSPGATLPATAELRLETTGGALVGSAVLTPDAGGNTVTLPGALANFRQDGWFYRAALEDDQGLPLAALPVEVVYACDDPVHCHLAVRAGVGAEPGSLVVGEQMAGAMDVVGAQPSSDLLGSILAMDPNLAGEVYTLGESIAARAPQFAPCTCFWVGVSSSSPASAHDQGYSDDPLYRSGQEGPGPAHLLKSRYDGGFFTGPHDDEAEVSGSATVALRMYCFEILFWRTIRVQLWPIGEIEIPVPELGDECDLGCTGQVGNFAEYHANSTGWTDAGLLGSARSAAQDEVAYDVNGVPVFNRALEVGKEVRKEWGFPLSASIAGIGLVTNDNGTQTTTGNPTLSFKIDIHYSVDGSDGTISRGFSVSGQKEVPQPASAKLETRGLSAAGGDSDSEAEGYTANSYSLAMYGFAPCATPRDATLWQYQSYEGRTEDMRSGLKRFFLGYMKVVAP